ncbi:MAG TPA: hypothetical protein GXX30_01925 [Firmicutes bacterium]|nr:hypothetical protein [Candidatus Fermentithermobacillaceae bacterium]
MRESSAGDLLIFRCEMPRLGEPSGREILNKVKGSVANGLSDIIVDEYEKLLVARLIDENYGYLASRDRDFLKKKVFLKLNGQDGARVRKSQGPYQRNQRKSRVWAKLAEYLEGEDEIVLEGFITFRLKEYLEELFNVVDETVEEHLVEREYREFLKLLRHFMDRQKSPASTINIVRQSGGSYQVLDDNFSPIKGEVGTFLKGSPEGLGLDIDDLVVSAVVTLAPEKVVWHGPKDDSPCFDLLKDLFEERFAICPGCSLEK